MEQKTFKAEEIKTGDAVHVNSMNMDGVVTSGPDSKNMVGVQFGSMNMQVKLSDLSPAAETMENAEKSAIGKHGFVNGKSKAGKKPEGSNIGNIKYEKALGVSTELKILGLTVDEAVIELSKYIDDASMAHIEKVRIVHGKGTGALRNAVWHYLKRDKHVKKYYQAEYGEGDAGVTIAELK